MGRDDVFVRQLGKVHVNYRSPAIAIVVQAVMAALGRFLAHRRMGSLMITAGFVSLLYVWLQPFVIDCRSELTARTGLHGQPGFNLRRPRERSRRP